MQRWDAQHWIVVKEGDKKLREILLLAMFVVWKERCSRIFTEKSKTWWKLVDEVQDMWRPLQ